ncbi:MAG: SHOCT domain-containing protein [Terrimesophilobacter sp.]
MMFGYGYGIGWLWLWGMLAVIGILVLIFVIVRVTAGGIKHNDTHVTSLPDAVGRSTPRQILEERYAKGELTTEEYRERLSVLGESTSGEDG